MDHFELSNQTSEDLRDIFIIVSDKKNLKVALIEKDFWVTVMLKYLFTRSPWKNNLLFKGGTCLSKCYGAIKRFSEDIDIVLDWRVLGFDINGPEIKESRKQKERVSNDLVKRSDEFLKNDFIPTMKKDLSEILNCDFSITYPSVGNIIFKYPSMYNTNSVKSEILIEIGPRGTWKDSEVKNITSYVSEILPDLCDETIPVLTTSLERAFCEKVLILHTVAFKGNMPDRYSRHYYDVHLIYKIISVASVKEMIKDTVDFKKRFFPGNYGYETMCRGKISLCIPADMMRKFKNDYYSMEEMIFDTAPSIEEITESLKEIELILNR